MVKVSQNKVNIHITTPLIFDPNSMEERKRPDDSMIEKLAKEIVPEKLYKDCSGFPTVEDKNLEIRQVLIKGINIGLDWQEALQTKQ